MNLYATYGKRPLDVLLSISILTVSTPIILITIAFLSVQNRGKVFFIQERPGKDVKPFSIIKFKTMNDKRDEKGNLLPDKERMTKIGTLIRMLSIDELPQLLNVLKGDMSMIGPRPLLFKYVPLYNEQQLRRHDVKPGITGWAQVNGRNSISWQRKFELDLHYVNHLSFLLDMRIFWLTLVKIIQREGINQSTERPMEPFNGHN